MKIFVLLLLLPVTLQAQIYRCASQGATYYSQIPCANDAQEVVIDDHPMFSESAPDLKAEPGEQPAPAQRVRSQADSMKEFISTLRRQRTEQLQQLDSDIARLEAKLSASGDSPVDTSQQMASSQQLKNLLSSRSSIVEQYDSMLAEAERRVATLSAKSPEQGKQDN